MFHGQLAAAVANYFNSVRMKIVRPEDQFDNVFLMHDLSDDPEAQNWIRQCRLTMLYRLRTHIAQRITEHENLLTPSQIMSAQDLVPKTKFERQAPYSLIAEIAQAVKESEERLPVFPSTGFMQIDRIEEAFSRLGYVTCEEPYDPGVKGPDFDPVQARKYALSLIAETIRFIKTLPKP